MITSSNTTMKADQMLRGTDKQPDADTDFERLRVLTSAKRDGRYVRVTYKTGTGAESAAAKKALEKSMRILSAQVDRVEEFETLANEEKQS